MVRRYVVAAEQLDSGEWVKYEDYAALELQLRDAEAEIKQLRNYISDIPKSER